MASTESGSTDGPPEAYRLREEEHREARDEARRASLRLGTLRAVTFIAAATAFVLFDSWGGGASVAALAVGAGLALIFGFEVAAHRRVRRRERWHEQIRLLCREGLFRLDRRWDALDGALPPWERDTDPVEPDHPYARDLDVVGRTSLVRLLGPVTSERGRTILRQWLLEPAEPVLSRRRQEATRELASRLDARLTFAAHGRLDMPDEPGSVEPFLDWAEDDPWLGDRRGLRLGAWLLPAALVVLALGDVFLAWPPFWIVPAVAQAWILRRYLGRIKGEFQAVEDGGAPLHSYVPQLRLVESLECRAGALGDVAARVVTADGAASVALAGLVRLLDSVESRRNMFYAVLAPVLLLDVHLAAALDRWRARYGHSVRAWLDALGEWEALAALASLAHDHPSWAFPTFLEDGETVVRAGDLGHPLLLPGVCVRNDVEVGPAGSFLLVTGSNMSGKSTLLRAIGANVVLASAGGPVCASSLELPPVRVHTSMRVDDSVTEGVSLFMAELLRIRGIVEAADQEGGPPVLFLLDEILHGTNTDERRVAARAVIRHLVAAGAVGAVSTHDLTVARTPDLEETARLVHFREAVEEAEGRTRLSFDYVLRPGIATTRNALKLLDAVGLGGLEGLGPR